MVLGVERQNTCNALSLAARSTGHKETGSSNRVKEKQRQVQHVIALLVAFEYKRPCCFIGGDEKCSRINCLFQTVGKGNREVVWLVNEKFTRIS
jgi:hypothetical protein